MKGYTMVKIDNDTLLEMLRERVEFWGGGCFDGARLDIMESVDNDHVNWCRVIEQGDEEFDELLEVYKKQGFGDCSCETDYASYIEAVDNEDEPTTFLIRH